MFLMVGQRMNPTASDLPAKAGLPLGALGSLTAQQSIRGRVNRFCGWFDQYFVGTEDVDHDNLIT